MRQNISLSEHFCLMGRDGRRLRGRAGPMIVAAAAAACVLYGLGVRRVGRWPPGRTVAFVAGTAAVVAAVVPPLGPLDGRRLTAHVAQHLLLGMAAPLLLALGAPITLALRSAPSPAARRRLRRALDTPAAALAFHPVVAFPLFTGTLFVLYLTPLFEASLRHAWLHDLVHAHFLAAGVLFLWPLVGPDPVPVRVPPAARLLLALLTVPAHALLGLALLGTDRLVADGWYAAFLDDPLGEQRRAATLLWTVGDVLGLAIAAAVLAQWYRREAAAGRVSGSPV